MASTYGGFTYGGSSGGSWGSTGVSHIGTGWYIDSTVADGLEVEHPSLVRGDTASLTVRFDDSQGLDPVARYESLRERLKWSHAVVNKTLLDGTPKYKEQHNQQSLLAEFIPGEYTQATEGFYGLLVGYEDKTKHPQVECRLDLEVRVLADRDAYADKTALRKDLEI